MLYISIHCSLVTYSVRHAPTTMTTQNFYDAQRRVRPAELRSSTGENCSSAVPFCHHRRRLNATIACACMREKKRDERPCYTLKAKKTYPATDRPISRLSRSTAIHASRGNVASLAARSPPTSRQ